MIRPTMVAAAAASALHIAPGWTQETQSGEAPAFVEPDKRVGRLVRIIRPEYPAEAVKQGLQGSVEVVGLSNPSGRLTEIAYKPVSAAAAAFVPALEKVVPFWEYLPPVGPDCMPSRVPVTTRVDFELAEGQPRIFVTHAKTSLAELAVESRFKPADFNRARQVDPRYPRQMQRENLEAHVYAFVAYDASGAVADIKAKAYFLERHLDKDRSNRHGLQRWLESQREADLRPFEQETLAALRQWRLVPMPEGTPLRKGCWDVVYRFTD